ncbi:MULTISPECIES: cation:proton antiporter [unclassified Roseateles]|uniref:cation:proton antiporter n=1 Tax=unclassified Roseateles TaxID=2626991 RepID=UPI0007023AD5|nr:MULTISPECIES: cation:proton antiporter [unclassified Roseateles]KQW51266.1 sodium:proton antiporter [Pelomonas sp. Root405]KRA77498.1 sodium:proton antiporter [Pelomonas sp. Root662]
MHENMTLISTLAAAFGLALVLGLLAQWARLPALVGYLLAGVLIGPHTPGFVGDVHLAQQLSEVGVMLLMFGVGLHFSVGDLMSVKNIALPGALVQMAAATAMGAAMAHGWWGWDVGASLIFGLALSVASTVVLLRALESRSLLHTGNGRIAVGWLVVEDLAMVLALVLIPVLGGKGDGGSEGNLAVTIVTTLLAVAAFVAVMLIAGRRLLPWMLWQVNRTGSRELFTLATVAAAIGLAVGAAALFGVSVALGAFFAGLVLRESAFSERAAHESLPLRDAFAVLFFVAVGMLFDPLILIERPMAVLATVAVILVGKTVAAGVLVILLKYPLSTALTVAVSLAQIGEFSFILMGLGQSLNLIPPEATSLVVAGAIVSIALNPVLFAGVEPLRNWVLKRSAWARQLEARDDPLAELPADTPESALAGQIVLVGHGSLGAALRERLSARPVVVVDSDRDIVERLRAAGQAAVLGEAAEAMTLVQAHIAQAAWLVVTVTDVRGVPAMLAIAQQLNPTLKSAVVARTDEEAQWLRDTGVTRVLRAHAALADALAHAVSAEAA